MTRARELGITFDGAAGPWNAITDIGCVEVGYTTLIENDGASAVRTGVTAVLPRGRAGARDPVFAGWFALNGNGEMTGTAWLDEAGVLEGPVMITNTHSVGIVRDAVIRWQLREGTVAQKFALPVVTETCDAFLNDMNGFHVRDVHALEALENARSGVLEEGNVGGGTGMVCYRFKGGTGTASRVLKASDGGWRVGVLVQSNFGLRHQLVIRGIPVGHAIANHLPAPARDESAGDTGSIIGVVATDAPLLPHQLKRIAKRAALGMARTGGTAANGSGDLFIAFSTANAGLSYPRTASSMVEMLAGDGLSALFDATVYATEEAIVNSLVAAQTMKGYMNHEVYALPHDKVQALIASQSGVGRRVTLAQGSRP